MQTVKCGADGLISGSGSGCESQGMDNPRSKRENAAGSAIASEGELCACGG